MDTIAAGFYALTPRIFFFFFFFLDYLINWLFFLQAIVTLARTEEENGRQPTSLMNFKMAIFELI